MSTVTDFSATLSNGNEVALGDYAGKVLLIVNTASKCGFTPQYTGLESLQKTYSANGFSVLAFPCNQFGGQEPGNEQEIESFCDLN
jgi:glutathione peroxidase